MSRNTVVSCVCSWYTHANSARVCTRAGWCDCLGVVDAGWWLAHVGGVEWHNQAFNVFAGVRTRYNDDGSGGGGMSTWSNDDGSMCRGLAVSELRVAYFSGQKCLHGRELGKSMRVLWCK